MDCWCACLVAMYSLAAPRLANMYNLSSRSFRSSLFAQQNRHEVALVPPGLLRAHVPPSDFRCKGELQEKIENGYLPAAGQFTRGNPPTPTKIHARVHLPPIVITTLTSFSLEKSYPSHHEPAKRSQRPTCVPQVLDIGMKMSIVEKAASPPQPIPECLSLFVRCSQVPLSILLPRLKPRTRIGRGRCEQSAAK